MLKRQIQATLRESAFNPKDAGHLGPILDGAQSDYLMLRAAEILRSSTALDAQTAKARIRDAISLAAAASVLLGP